MKLYVYVLILAAGAMGQVPNQHHPPSSDDQKLLDIAGKDAPANLKTILAAPDDPRLPDNSVDVIFFCDVLHHIENRAAYYPQLAKALKSGGRIVVIEFYKKEMPIGPPPSMKLSDDEVIAEFRRAGFTLAKRLDILPYQTLRNCTLVYSSA